MRDLARDGLTPAVDLVRHIQREVPLPLRVMVRASDTFACRSDDERRTLADQAGTFDALGVDGIVIGWIRDGRIDEETLASVLDAAPRLNATFHRAFDALDDSERALRVLQQYRQIDRVLTAAGTGPWTARCETLRQLTRWAGARIVVLPGGRIDQDSLRALAACGAVSEAHVGRAARVGRAIDAAVSADAVRALMLAARSK